MELMRYLVMLTSPDGSLSVIDSFISNPRFCEDLQQFKTIVQDYIKQSEEDNKDCNEKLEISNYAEENFEMNGNNPSIHFDEGIVGETQWFTLVQMSDKEYTFILTQSIITNSETGEGKFIDDFYDPCIPINNIEEFMNHLKIKHQTPVVNYYEYGPNYTFTFPDENIKVSYAMIKNPEKLIDMNNYRFM